MLVQKYTEESVKRFLDAVDSESGPLGERAMRYKHLLKLKEEEESETQAATKDG